MRARSAFVAAAILTIGFLPSAAAQADAARTDVWVTFGAKTVRFSWTSSDGAFADVSAPSCQVQDGAAYFLCMLAHWELRTVRENPDGSVTYDFVLAGAYGNPFLVQVLGPTAIVAVGATPVWGFWLEVSWTRIPGVSGVASAEPVLVKPGSCIGTLCSHGSPFGIGLAVVAGDGAIESPAPVPSPADALVDFALAQVDCIRTRC